MSILASNRIQSRVSSTLYSETSPLVGAAPQTTQYKPRDTTARTFNLGLAEDGVVDMGIALRLTLDAECTVDLTAMHLEPTNSTGQTLWTGDLPADSRVYFLPERGSYNAGLPGQQIVDIVELRMPIHRIRLRITPKTEPTDGEIQLRLIRRY